jgi:hypothetical protein
LQHQTKYNVKHVAISQETNSINMWHQIIGHLNASSLKVLLEKKLIEGLSINSKAKLYFCESYVQGKQHKPTFPKEGGLQAIGFIGLIHSDIWGLVKTPSLTRTKYFLYFVDNFSRIK